MPGSLSSFHCPNDFSFEAIAALLGGGVAAADEEADADAPLAGVEVAEEPVPALSHEYDFFCLPPNRPIMPAVASRAVSLADLCCSCSVNFVCSILRSFFVTFFSGSAVTAEVSDPAAVTG